MSMPFVYLWDASRYGTPKSLEQALDMLLVLADKPEVSMSEKVLAFAEEFGCFVDGSGETSWLNVLAGTGAYARACDKAVLRLELPDIDWQPVLVEMVDIANKHGLVALHEEGASLFLPNGKVLPAGRAKAWTGLRAALKNELGFPQTLGQFKKWLTPQVEMMLARHGAFYRDEMPWGENIPAYVKDGAGGTSLYLSVTSEGSAGHFGFNFHYAIKNSYVYEICRKFNFFRPDVVGWGEVIGSIIDDVNFSDIYVNNHAASIAHLNFIEKTIFPALDNIFSIKLLDDLLNGHADNRFRKYHHNFVFKPQCLVVARLAGNPDFEGLAKELAADNGWYANEDVWKDEWPKLVKYLRDEVQPIN